MAAELIKYRESNRKLKVEVDFLKKKIVVSADKLNKEVDSNTNLIISVKMAKESIFPMPATDEDRRQFLSHTNCMELLNPVELKGDSIYCLDKLPMAVPIYGPEGVMFVKTDKPRTIAIQMSLYADSWDNPKSRNSRRSEREGGTLQVSSHPLKLIFNLKIECQRT